MLKMEVQTNAFYSCLNVGAIHELPLRIHAQNQGFD